MTSPHPTRSNVALSSRAGTSDPSTTHGAAEALSNIWHDKTSREECYANLDFFHHNIYINFVYDLHEYVQGCL